MNDVILGSADYESRLTELAAIVKKQQDEVAKMRRSFNDIIYNLDSDNMPEVARLILKYRDENRIAVASLNTTLTEKETSMRLLVEDYRTESNAAVDAVDKKVADVSATVAENDASVRLLVEDYREESSAAVDAVDKKVADVSATVAENDASVRLLVEDYREESNAAVDAVDKKVADVSATVAENDSSVRLLVENYQEENRRLFGGIDESIASLTATASDNTSKISLVVGQDGRVDGSVIVKAINGNSTVRSGLTRSI